MPFGDNLPFDLIAVGPDLRLWKVQVKFARAYRGAIRIKNWRQSENTRRRYERTYTLAQVDVFAVYCPDTDLVYYVSQAKVGEGMTFHLRVARAKNQQQAGIHWHLDYRDFRDASETTSSGPEMAKI